MGTIWEHSYHDNRTRWKTVKINFSILKIKYKNFSHFFLPVTIIRINATYFNSYFLSSINSLWGDCVNINTDIHTHIVLYCETPSFGYTTGATAIFVSVPVTAAPPQNNLFNPPRNSQEDSISKLENTLRVLEFKKKINDVEKSLQVAKSYKEFVSYDSGNLTSCVSIPQTTSYISSTEKNPTHSSISSFMVGSEIDSVQYKLENVFTTTRIEMVSRATIDAITGRKNYSTSRLKIT